jgi:branched-chain amino acid transport system substrate-binding protein
MPDYFTLLNERDGGIGGVMVAFLECETGYNTEKGVECYEATKGEGALVYQPLSTGITYQLIPKATADQHPGPHDGLWPHLGRQRQGVRVGVQLSRPTTGTAPRSREAHDGGQTKAVTSKARRSRWSITTRPMARSRSARWKSWPKKHGFELTPAAGRPSRPGAEVAVAADPPRTPDYVLMWGWGVMNQVAIQEAANIRFPMENFIGIWWSGSENDVLPRATAPTATRR